MKVFFQEPEAETDIITSIIIEGNASVLTQTIENELLIKTGDVYTSYLINRSLKNIRALGQFSKVTDSYDNGILTIIVEERPIISEIIIEGNTLFPNDELLTLLSSKVNTVSNINSIRDDISLLNQKYETEGYIKAKVIQVKNPTVDNPKLIYVVTEGILESFTITGNSKTKDYVITREIQLEPGKPLNQSALKESIRRVFNLNYFTNISPEIVDGDDPENVNVIFNIEEKETSGSFSFGGGYNPTSGFSLFTDLNWDNIAGSGKAIMLRSNFGLGSQSQSDVSNSTYQFKYTDPWAFGEHKSFTFRTWKTSGSFVTNPLDTSSGYSVWDENKIGFDMTFGVPHSYNLRTTHRFKYESINLPQDVDNNGETLDEVDYYIYSYAFGVSYDTRDYFMNPTEGVYHTFNIEQGLKFRLTALDFTQFDLGLRKFIPISKSKNQVIATRTELGSIISPEINIDDINAERKFSSQKYYIGGANTVRGYSDRSPFSSGYHRLLVNLEYRYIFNQTFQVILFADAGNAVNYFSELNQLNQFRIGKGIGVRILLPALGPIRLDYGFGDNQDADSGQFIHFSVGQAF